MWSRTKLPLPWRVPPPTPSIFTPVLWRRVWAQVGWQYGAWREKATIYGKADAAQIRCSGPIQQESHRGGDICWPSKSLQRNFVEHRGSHFRVSPRLFSHGCQCHRWVHGVYSDSVHPQLRCAALGEHVKRSLGTTIGRVVRQCPCRCRRTNVDDATIGDLSLYHVGCNKLGKRSVSAHRVPRCEFVSPRAILGYYLC